MKHMLNPFPVDTLPITRRDYSGRISKTCNSNSRLTPPIPQKPTIQITKQDGEYSIVMNPMKDTKKLETDCNPYLNCSPLKFKIKKRPEEIQKHRAKKLLRDRGFHKKCSCLDLTRCLCMSPNAKKVLSYEMKSVSNQLKLKTDLEFADLGESSDSELDVEFTTPSAVISNRKHKPDVTHCGTQYFAKDFLPQKIKNVVTEEKPKTTLGVKEPVKAQSQAQPKASQKAQTKAQPKAQLK